MFTNLHQHSMYSVGDGYATIDELVNTAKQLNYRAVALTDHGTTTGLFPMYEVCKQNGMKPILGMEGYFCEEPDIKDGTTQHILLIAKNYDGLKNLYRLSTYGAHHFYKKPRIGLEALREYRDGIIVTTACIGGVFNQEDGEKLCLSLRDIFQQDFFMEIQPHDFDRQRDYNRKVISFADKHSIPVIVTCDSHYAIPDDIKYHRAWVSIRGTEEAYASNDFYMMGEFEIIQRLTKDGLSPDKIREYVQNTNSIVDRCDIEIPIGKDNYPKYGAENPERLIRDWCNEGWKQHGLSKAANRRTYIDRVNRELPILKQCDYLNYLCIIKDIITYCKENDILTGLGRGSVGGCLTAYLSGITSVDSIRWGTIFERFCNPERVTPCDIDVDFESVYRDDVIEYISQMYGEVYHVRTMNFMQEKAAIKRAGQALGIPPATVNKISTNFHDWEGVTDETLRDVARHFVGRIQSYGSHASAIMVFPKEATNWCAVERQGDIFVCATDYHDLEKQGCLKLDLLGLTQLSIVHYMADLMGKDVSELWNNIPLTDKLTCDMLNAGKTDGCFQIESATMKGFTKSIHVASADDMSIVVALCRPGPLDSGMAAEYLENRKSVHVPKVYEPMDKVLHETNGVILYQEQVMQLARVLCGYTLGEADILRKIIGRKIVDEMKPAMDTFVKRGIEYGTPKEIIEPLAEAISKSANYLFNKSHSVAYGLTAWRTAYLKAHYTPYYFAALLAFNKYDKAKFSKYISCAQQMGIEVVVPKLNKYTNINMIGDTTVDNGTIILGLDTLKNVGISAHLLTLGHDGKQFLEDNANANKRILESIVKAGALSGNRNELLQYVAWLKDKHVHKPPFEYNPINDIAVSKMELDSIGVTFNNVADEYDTSVCDGTTTFLVTVTKKKAHKTKTGKPMHFVTGDINGVVRELVIFDNKGTDLQANVTYVMRISGTVIQEFMEAKRKENNHGL